MSETLGFSQATMQDDAPVAPLGPPLISAPVSETSSLGRRSLLITSCLNTQPAAAAATVKIAGLPSLGHWFLDLFQSF